MIAMLKPLVRAAAIPGVFISFGVLCAQEPSSVFVGVGIYGTERFDGEAIRREFAGEVDQLVVSVNENDDARVDEIIALIEEQLRSRAPLAFIDVSLGTFIAGAGPLELSLAINVVEEGDRARRMPFRPAPVGSYADPGGLFALWDEYEAQALELVFSGALQGYVLRCPVLHCLTSFEHRQLIPYLQSFNEGANDHETLLYEIVEDDQDEHHRATAIFLLAHTNNADRLLPVLGRAIYDPSGGVRNNAMRVMMSIAEREPKRDYPISDLIIALDFPSVDSRNKAAYTLLHLAEVAKHAEIIRVEGLPNLLRLLRARNPLTHDPAYEILKTVSGEDFGPRDYAAWEAWAARDIE